MQSDLKPVAPMCAGLLAETEEKSLTEGNFDRYRPSVENLICKVDNNKRAIKNEIGTTK